MHVCTQAGRHKVIGQLPAVGSSLSPLHRSWSLGHWAYKANTLLSDQIFVSWSQARVWLKTLEKQHPQRKALDDTFKEEA